jgi:hypothetical protein
MADHLLDAEAVTAKYAAHVDRWLAGQEDLKLPHEFIAEEFAAALVAKVLAEQGWLAS